MVGNALGPIWQCAENAIARCDELHIVGYSFPVTDTKAIELLSKAIARRSTPLPIIVANPFPGDIGDRLKGRFGAMVDVSVKELYFVDYLKELAAGP